MTTDVTDQDYFKDCAYYLTEAKTTFDVFKAWTFFNHRHPELSAIVALPKYTNKRKNIARERILSSNVYKKYLVTYFTKDELYFVSDELLKAPYLNKPKEVEFYLDHTISFDTNIASYINTIVRGKKLVVFEAKDYKITQYSIINLLDQILIDNLNFDYVFYLLENTKSIYHHIKALKKDTSPLNFWKLLDKDFRWNIVSLILFSRIDSVKYKKSPSLKSEINFRDACRLSIEETYKYYNSEAGKALTDQTFKYQKLLLLYLIGMYRINISSKKSAKTKINEFFLYIQETVGVYLDREMIAVHKYFCHQDNIPFFKRLNFGKLPKIRRTIFEGLDNLAWDMTSPLLLENFILSRGKGKYMIPYFLSFDTDLNDYLNSFLIKSTIFNSKTGVLTPIPEKNTRTYFDDNNCNNAVDWFFTDESIRQRKNLIGKMNELNDLNSVVLKEYTRLRKVMNKKNKQVNIDSCATI